MSWPLLALLTCGCGAADETGGSTEGDSGGTSGTTQASSSGASSTAAQTSTASPTGEAGSSSGTSEGSSTATTSGGSSSGSSDTSTGPGFHGTPGCGLEPSGALDGTIDVDGVERSYILETPQGYDPSQPYPLIFGFHGSFDTGSGAQLGYQLFSHFEGEAIVVYPDGLPLSPDGPTGWRTANGSADMNFVMELAETIGLEMCFDLRKVYAFGYSQGATMANSMACYRGDLFSGVGAIAGVAPSGALCQGPVAALVGHGLSDDQVPYSQGEATRDLWSELAGCAQTSMPVAPESCVLYDGCAEQSPVVWCSYEARHMFDGIYAEAAVALFRSLWE